jgi:hypothetical protein
VGYPRDPAFILPDEEGERARETGEQRPAGSRGSRLRLEAEGRNEGGVEREKGPDLVEEALRGERQDDVRRDHDAGGMIWSMRVKTSVTIDERVLRGIDKATTRTRSRSRVIEDAAREFLVRRARAARESRDLEILDRSADALNREMEDVLAYQADV